MSRDLVSVHTAPMTAAVPMTAAAPSPDGDYTDIDLSNMRKVSNVRVTDTEQVLTPRIQFICL